MNNLRDKSNKSEAKVFKCDACGSFNEIKLTSDGFSTSAKRKILPEGLESLLVEFTVNLLKKNPADLNEMYRDALEYFTARIHDLSPIHSISSNKAILSSKYI